ncbi:isochorismatase family protein [Rhodococcus sp. JT-3]|uniref:isochorismatase family protein n=1 Tax=Rhodococcus sp. JT-3 TaxID=1973213 RepID=UPI001303139E|nr:isochorismatase family protein [Rhodococcus sp. JT-3]
MADYSQHWGERTKSVYETAGFGSKSRRGSRPAIVVVDLTRGFTEPGYPSGSDLTDVVSATASLCATGRATRTPIVYTTIAYTSAEAEGTAITWLDKATGIRALREGSDAVDFDPRLTVTGDDHVIIKKGASAFFGTHLASLLVGLGCDTVLVCGATTSGCVRATAVDAVQSGFGVLVPRDCVGDRASGPHEASLFDIEAKYGDVVELADAVTYLESTAAAAVR